MPPLFLLSTTHDVQVRGLLTIPGFSADRALETVTSPLLRQSIVEMLTTLTTSEQDTWPDALHKVGRRPYMQACREGGNLCF
jgi:hypothetical protein